MDERSFEMWQQPNIQVPVQAFVIGRTCSSCGCLIKGSCRCDSGQRDHQNKNSGPSIEDQWEELNSGCLE